MLLITFNENDIKNIGSNSTTSNNSNGNGYPNDFNNLNKIKYNNNDIDQNLYCLTSKIQNFKL
ncbi:hypothetical protein RB653_006364 [Dictyostelium firmibasis]|uniref:Uncharacterized protein n=1 Tax=Dictyostelium firmibasis TaxID=79012 RepID=A0AAN7U9K7_9MYCE